MVQSLLSLTGIRDLETGKHSSRTERYARVLAEQLARNPRYAGYLSAERIDLLASLAPLHDIGKVGVPDRVLNKPSELTPEELAEMRRHPEYGRDVILKAEREAGVHDDAILSMAKEIVYTHHEKWDGTGYPQGLRGNDIPIPGRVMALVDVWDAILHAAALPAAHAARGSRGLHRKGRGTHFDPAVVDAFEQVADQMHELSLSPRASIHNSQFTIHKLLRRRLDPQAPRRPSRRSGHTAARRGPCARRARAGGTRSAATRAAAPPSSR